MPTRRCLICNQYKHIEEQGICCSACHETELDLLIKTYAFIHCSGSDFVPGKMILDNVEAVNGVGVTLMFIRSWIMRQWLEKNEVEAVCVPKPIQDNLAEGGFAVTPEILRTLDCLRNHKPVHDTKLLEGLKEKPQPEEKVGRNRMAVVSRLRKE